MLTDRVRIRAQGGQFAEIWPFFYREFNDKGVFIPTAHLDEINWTVFPGEELNQFIVNNWLIKLYLQIIQVNWMFKGA